MAEGKGEKTGTKPRMLEVVKPYVTIFFAELIGTMILLFVGCGSTIDFSDDPVVPHHLKGMGFGLTVLLAIQIFGHISACHMNPVVSIISLLLGFINIIQFVVYLLAEFLGSLLGFWLLKVLFPERYTPSGFCMTKIADEVTVTQAFFIELIITCILCLVVCSVWDHRNASNGDSTAIRFGFVVTILSIMAGTLTGASMNTARSFGPAVFGSLSDWKDQWIYWIAPNISPFLSVGLYKVFFAASKEEVTHSSENMRNTR
ncbi:hypothetical protein WA026_006100 [Henosepilachna vigintioctopunctata]